MAFVKVKDCFLCRNIQNLFHSISFVCPTHLTEIYAIPKNGIEHNPNTNAPISANDATEIAAIKNNNPTNP